MRPITVTLVAQDIGGCNGLGALEQTLVAQGHFVHRYLAFGKSIQNSENIPSSVAQSDVVVCGMSSSPELSKHEMQAAQIALSRGENTKVCFFADAHNSHRRTWLQDVLPKTHAFFVLDEKESAKASAHFPNLTVVASGNPAWDAYAFPKLTSREVRNFFEVYGTDEKIILAVGTKDATINILLWGCLLEATRNFALPVTILASMHGGDKNPPELYQDLSTYSDGRLQIVTSKEMPGSDILIGADVMVDSLSTMCIQAGFLRKPVITFASEMALNRLEKINGSRNWEPVYMGITELVRGDTLHLRMAILEALTGPTHPCLRRQEELFQIPPEPGASASRIAEVLTSLVH